jgi:DegV family protein with EDD domain
MSSIAIVTDSDSSIPPALGARYAIQQVPITIHFADESFTTGIDIDDALVFKKIDQRNKLPTTAAPSPNAFANAYQKAFDEGADSIVCICVSSKVSATYSSAMTACEMFPARDISVLDSQLISMGQGFMVIAAAEAARAGENKAEVIAVAEDTAKRVHLFALLSTLKYLAMSGRVGKLVAGMADTLNIKPILTMRDGKLDLLERIRTRKKAQERLLELTCQALDGKAAERVAMIHVNNLEGVREVQEQLCELLSCPQDIVTADFTPGLAVHAGTGVVGVALVAAK